MNGVIDMMNIMEIWNWIDRAAADYALLAATWSAYLILLMFVTWILFLAVMKLQDVQKIVGFTKVNKIPALGILAIGLAYDSTLNVAMSIVMLDLPKIDFTNPMSVENEYLLSPHVSRLTHSTGNSVRERWARGWARFICYHFLVPVDKTHCDKPQ